MALIFRLYDDTRFVFFDGRLINQHDGDFIADRINAMTGDAFQTRCHQV